eukprot:TRINITY_DN31_c0_g1_i1.p2 TRINITY_DN31_c0_g1~~TRINITY_DN31_c0_g1_i1.p2  ORF type:complete len:217 (+),score=26.22 TRINITY_DN31_c0_g1_i1:164-814(+)
MLRSLVGSEMCIRDRVSTQSTGASEFDMDNKQTDGASEATIPARSCELVSRGSETTSFNVLTPFGVYEGAVEDGVWTKGPPDLFCPQCRICKTTCRIIACGDSELGIKPWYTLLCTILTVGVVAARGGTHAVTPAAARPASISGPPPLQSTETQAECGSARTATGYLQCLGYSSQCNLAAESCATRSYAVLSGRFDTNSGRNTISRCVLLVLGTNQ